MLIPYSNFFHPGSRFRIKELKYFNPKKWFLGSRNLIQVVHPGSGSWFFIHPGSRDQKGTGSQIPDPDPQHWRNSSIYTLKLLQEACPCWQGGELWGWILSNRKLFCTTVQSSGRTGFSTPQSGKCSLYIVYSYGSFWAVVSSAWDVDLHPFCSLFIPVLSFFLIQKQYII